MIEYRGTERGSKYKTQQRPIGLVLLSGKSSFPVSMSLPQEGAHVPQPHSMTLRPVLCLSLSTVSPVSGNSAKNQSGVPRDPHSSPNPWLIFTNSLISQEGFEEPLTAVLDCVGLPGSGLCETVQHNLCPKSHPRELSCSMDDLFTLLLLA